MMFAFHSLVIIVATLHLWFLILEMFLWTKPLGLKTFGTTREFAQTTKILAANQGLYNGFLSAGLYWSLWRTDHVSIFFFLICVILAGIYGGLTADRKIILVQAMPAVVALLLGLVIYGKTYAP
jgi:putative membrane protein